MSPSLLFQNACINEMYINITKITVTEEVIQYSYSDKFDNHYFLRISKHRIIHGQIIEDKGVASGLPFNVLKYLIENFNEVNFYELSA
jgi:hypothetical protein